MVGLPYEDLRERVHAAAEGGDMIHYAALGCWCRAQKDWRYHLVADVLDLATKTPHIMQVPEMMRGLSIPRFDEPALYALEVTCAALRSGVSYERWAADIIGYVASSLAKEHKVNLSPLETELATGVPKTRAHSFDAYGQAGERERL